MANRNQDSLGKPKKSRRVRKWHFVALILVSLLLLVVVFLPQIVTSKTILTSAINRFAGISPLRVEFERVDAGWFAPVRATGIQLLDGENRVLAKVGEVQTAKGALSWITSSSDLGKVVIKDFEAQVVTYDGTSDIEEALKPLLDNLQNAEEVPEDDAEATPITGSIEIVNANLMLMESGRSEKWVVGIPNMEVSLPEAGQIIGPISAQVNIGDVSGTVANSNGAIAASVQQSPETQAFEVRAKMQNVPADFWHAVHARLPEVPINELQGRISAVLAGNIIDDTHWSFDIRQLEATNLSMTAPQLVGDTPAQLQLISGGAMCSLANDNLSVTDATLVCDFASAQANASIPWPITTPTLADPFIAGAVINAQGNVDLPKLIQAANSLLPIREGTELLAGSAQFRVGQQIDAAGQPSSLANLELKDLRAIAAGQQLTWKDPLRVELTANRDQGALKLAALAAAEFANLQGGGSLEAGSLVGNVNLAQLRQRVSQWIELPITDMNGDANLDIGWNLQNGDLLVTRGTFETTPVVVKTTTNRQLSEPAWRGAFNAQLRMAGGTPTIVEIANLRFDSRDERLSVDLKQPLHLTSTEGVEHPPAAFSVDVATNLANCKDRATVWLAEPPEMELDGSIQLAASGLIDLEHVEVLSANWNGEPVRVVTPQFSYVEPKVVGNFKGRVDTNDLTRMVIDSLELTGSSVSLIAQDQANPDGSDSRVGRAKFLVDLGRVLQNASTANLEQPAAASAETKVSASGMCTGELAWQISGTSAGVNTAINFEDLVVLSQSPAQIAPMPIWEEKSVATRMAGTWIAETGSVDLENMSIQTPWMQYAGKLTYRVQDTQQAIQVNGQANYDSGQLALKLQPFTGGQVQLAGQQSVPIEVTWASDSNHPATSTLATLNAATRLGWEQAIVAGIQLGRADVPISVTNGLLKTAAEIPVSGGALRWDVESDLAAEELVIRQSPMTVLDNVAITQEMCKGWLKYVTPLVAEATQVDGRLSLRLDEAKFTPVIPEKQTVAGQLILHNATIGPGPLSNQVIGIVKQIEAIRKKDFTQAVSSTQRVWMDMPEQAVDFQMRDGLVTHRNLSVEIGDVAISTQGSVSVNGQMDMVASMPIPDDWAEKSPWLAGLRGQTLQFPIGGTLSQPQVDTQLLRQLGRQTVQNAASGLLQQGLNRGIDKLLGGAGGEAAQPSGQPDDQNPVLGIGAELLKGQGINLPGLFGGQKQSGGDQ